MKGFHRENQLLSLCGLNCGLCPMFLGKYCGGCGNGNQSCALARCSLTHGAPAYCWECAHYPCEQYQHFDDHDSFISHSRRRADVERAQTFGITAYNVEQEEKMQILHMLLSCYNDGRRKSFFCTAVNLLELPELREALQQINSHPQLPDLPIKEKSAYAAGILHSIAQKRGIECTLHKKSRKKP